MNITKESLAIAAADSRLEKANLPTYSELLDTLRCARDAMSDSSQSQLVSIGAAMLKISVVLDAPVA